MGHECIKVSWVNSLIKIYNYTTPLLECYFVRNIVCSCAGSLYEISGVNLFIITLTETYFISFSILVLLAVTLSSSRPSNPVIKMKIRWEKQYLITGGDVHVCVSVKGRIVNIPSG